MMMTTKIGVLKTPYKMTLIFNTLLIPHATIWRPKNLYEEWR